MADQEPVISDSILRIFYYLLLLIVLITLSFAIIITSTFILSGKAHASCDCQSLILLVLGLFVVSTAAARFGIRPPQRPKNDPEV